MKENFRGNTESKKVADWQEYIAESEIELVHKEALATMLETGYSEEGFLYKFADYLNEVFPKFYKYDEEVTQNNKYGTAMTIEISDVDKKLYDLFSDIRNNRWDGTL